MLVRVFLVTFLVLAASVSGSSSAAPKPESVMIVPENVSAPTAVVDLVSDRMATTLLRMGLHVVPAGEARRLVSVETSTTPTVPIDAALRVARRLGVDYLLTAWVDLVRSPGDDACGGESCNDSATVVLRTRVIDVATGVMSGSVQMKCRIAHLSVCTGSGCEFISSNQQAFVDQVDEALQRLREAAGW